MDPFSIEYETTDGTVVAAGGEPSPEPTPAVVEAGTPSPEAAPPAPADPFAEHGLDPQTIAELAEYAPLLRQIQQAQQEAANRPDPAATPTLDPFSEDFGQNLTALIQQAVQQGVAPLTEHQQAQVLAEADERALDILRDDATRNGEFINGDDSLKAARSLAEAILPQFQQRYGFGPRAAEAALAAAAQQVRQIEQNAVKAGEERYKNQMATLSSAPKDPGTGTVASEVPGQYKDEMEAVAAFIARTAA